MCGALRRHYRFPFGRHDELGDPEVLPLVAGDGIVVHFGPSTSTPSGVHRCLKAHTGHWSSRTVPGHGGETQFMPPPFIAETTTSLRTASSRRWCVAQPHRSAVRAATRRAQGDPAQSGLGPWRRAVCPGPGRTWIGEPDNNRPYDLANTPFQVAPLETTFAGVANRNTCALAQPLRS